MGVKFNSVIGRTGIYVRDDSKRRSQNDTKGQEEKTVAFRNTYIPEIDCSCDDLLTNYAIGGLRVKNRRNKEIPNGYSRYEYKGGRFDIYRHNDEYKSQFVHPKNYDIDEFTKEFPSLEAQTFRYSKNVDNSIDDINGEIDGNISQSSLTGDCWLLSAILSMAQNEKGKEIIKNSITVNDDSTVTVSFKGIGVSYTLSEDEISRYDTDNYSYDAYSNGDNDMLVIELAVEKLWKDIEKGKVTLDSDNENITYTGEGYGIEDGGLPSQLVYYFTGVESNEIYYDDAHNIEKERIYEVLNDALNSTGTIIDVGIYDNVHSCTLADGSVYSLDLGYGGHALAVTKVTEDTVTFVNPWDSSVEYTASWSEFASLGIGYMAVSDLSQAVEKEVVDMTNNKETNYDYSYGYNYDYSFDSDYSRKDNYRYDYNFDYNDKIKPDNNPFDFSFNDDYGKTDFDKDYNLKPDSKYDYNEQTGIMSILYEFLDILSYLFSLLKI